MIALLAIGTFLLAALPAAENPFVGKWKFSLSKSKVTGQHDSVQSVGPNKFKFTYGTFSWTITANGTDQPGPFGTIAMTIADANTWKFNNKVKGITVSTETWTLAADGKSMVRAEQGKRHDGSSFQNETKYNRTAGGKSFEGTWQSSESKMNSPSEVTITANGDDGLTETVGTDNLTVSYKFDGAEYPIKGPQVPEGMTVTAKRTGPRRLRMTTRLKGKLLDTADITISPDGKTRTIVARDPGEKEPFVAVYELQ